MDHFFSLQQRRTQAEMGELQVSNYNEEPSFSINALQTLPAHFLFMAHESHRFVTEEQSVSSSAEAVRSMKLDTEHNPYDEVCCRQDFFNFSTFLQSLNT